MVPGSNGMLDLNHQNDFAYLSSNSLRNALSPR